MYLKNNNILLKNVNQQKVYKVFILKYGIFKTSL